MGINSADHIIVHEPNVLPTDSLLSVEALKQPGFNLGIIASLNLNKNISIRFLPSLSFQDRALTYTFREGPDSTSVFDKRVESTFIDFPINFKFRTDRLNNMAVYAVAGAKYSLDMQSQKDVKNAIADEIIIKTLENDYSVEFGGGFDFFLTYFKFGIELKMAVGIPNLLVNDETQFSAPLNSLRNRTFTFTLTFEG